MVDFDHKATDNRGEISPITADLEALYSIHSSTFGQIAQRPFSCAPSTSRLGGFQLGSDVNVPSESTRPAAWRSAAALVKTERILADNAIVAGGTIAAGILG